MTSDENSSAHDRQQWRGTGSSGVSGAIYGLGFIGAVIYYIQHATMFWGGVLGFLKALVWPAILVYRFLEFLKL